MDPVATIVATVNGWLTSARFGEEKNFFIPCGFTQGQANEASKRLNGTFDLGGSHLWLEAQELSQANMSTNLHAKIWH